MKSSLTFTNQVGSNNAPMRAYCLALRERYHPAAHLVLIQPPQFLLDVLDPEVIRNRGYYAFPPTGLQCLAKAIAHRGIDYNIIDLNFLLLEKVINEKDFGEWTHSKWLDFLDEILGDLPPSIIGVTCISVYNDVFVPEHPLTAVLDYLKNQDRHVVLAGGPIVASEYRAYLEKNLCHFATTGEGENKINCILDFILPDISHSAPVNGIYFFHDGHLEEVQGNLDVVKLDGCLNETYASIKIEKYCKVGSTNPFSRMAGLDKPFSTFQLNRGCRANCEFCDVPAFMGSGLRQFPVDDVLHELTYLCAERGVRHFEVLDDDFLGKGAIFDNTLRLLEGMVKLKRRYEITWAAGNGLIAASISNHVLQLMQESGCIGFRIGVESGDEKMQRRMRKPASLPSLRKVADLLQNYPSMFAGGNYIIGLFGEETFGEMLNTLHFAFELNLDWAGFTTFQVTSKNKVVDSAKSRKIATEFIPARDRDWAKPSKGSSILLGRDIFYLPFKEVPSIEQVKEIWFGFNLLSNYIGNKNLQPGGNPRKYVSWLEAIQLTYPKNAYIPLFSALGYLLLGDEENTAKKLTQVRKNLAVSDYWSNRFRQFQLDSLLQDFPSESREVAPMLASLLASYELPTILL